MKVRQSGKVRLGGKKNDTKRNGMIGRQQVQQEVRQGKKTVKNFGTEKFKRERAEVQKGTHKGSKKDVKPVQKEHAKGQWGTCKGTKGDEEVI